MEEKPRWEHGYRMHGYWLGTIRLGWVGLPHTAAGLKGCGYGYGTGVTTAGSCRTLKTAKRRVERLVAESRQH